MNIHISTAPAHFTIPQAWLEKFLYDPAEAAWVFFKIELDAFQSFRLKKFWFTPDSWDSSGYGSGKTIVDWVFLNLSATLLPDTHCLYISQTFQSGKDNFWKYYNELGTDLWRAQLGRFDMDGDEDGKTSAKEPGNWKVFFKDKSLLMMPAPNFLNESRNLAGMDVNRLLIDEFNKVLASTSGLAAVTQQLLGRVRRRCFNKNHPVWCNKTVRTSTAELGNHPAFITHQKFEKEVRKGNPDFAAFGFSYKDFSNLRCERIGKSFRDELRDEKKIKAMRLSLTDEKADAEHFAIWSRSSKGWYADSDLEACRKLGLARGVDVVIGRASDPLADENTHYFFGGDWARAKTEKNDAGAIVVGRAKPLLPDASDNESDWAFDFVYARKVTDADVDKWGGIVHEKNRDFGFSCMVGDAGGGGDFITPQLKKSRQTINGVEMDVTPIALRNDSTVMQASFILSIFLRSDDGIRLLWPELAQARGDDVLKFYANVMLQTGFAKQMIGLPPDHNARFAENREAYDGWPEERQWASRLLTKLSDELLGYNALTKEDGSWLTTSNGALQFRGDSGDDFHDAARNCLVAFRIWLKEHGTGWVVNKDAAALCGGW